MHTNDCFFDTFFGRVDGIDITKARSAGYE